MIQEEAAASKGFPEVLELPNVLRGINSERRRERHPRVLRTFGRVTNFRAASSKMRAASEK